VSDDELFNSDYASLTLGKEINDQATVKKFSELTPLPEEDTWKAFKYITPDFSDDRFPDSLMVYTFKALQTRPSNRITG
jgi:hypothetical protein